MGQALMKAFFFVIFACLLGPFMVPLIIAKAFFFPKRNYGRYRSRLMRETLRHNRKHVSYWAPTASQLRSKQ